MPVPSLARWGFPRDPYFLWCPILPFPFSTRERSLTVVPQQRQEVLYHIDFHSWSGYSLIPSSDCVKCHCQGAVGWKNFCLHWAIAVPGSRSDFTVNPKPAAFTQGSRLTCSSPDFCAQLSNIEAMTICFVFLQTVVLLVKASSFLYFKYPGTYADFAVLVSRKAEAGGSQFLAWYLHHSTDT